MPLAPCAAQAGTLRCVRSAAGCRQRSRAICHAIVCQEGPGQPARTGPTRRMILMRHSDSEPASAGLRDFDRPITAEGAAAAREVAAQLQQRGWVPQVVLCSNALRTRQTYDAMCQVMPELEQADAHFLGSLFTTPALDGQTRTHLSEIVCAEVSSDSHSCVLALGHDRGWSEAASSFCGQPVRLGNSHAALLEGAGASWEEAMLEGTAWQLVEVLLPNAAHQADDS